MKDIQSGLMLCKSFSPDPFWVIFGNVKTPSFLMNTKTGYLHRDKRGYGFLLIPTMAIGIEKCYGDLTINEFLERCSDLGLREHPNYFLGIIYSLVLNSDNKNEIDSLAADFKKCYSDDELKIRLATVYTILEESNEYGNYFDKGYYFDKEKVSFKCTNRDDWSILSKVQILNIIIKALSISKDIDLYTILSTGKTLNKSYLK